MSARTIAPRRSVGARRRTPKRGRCGRDEAERVVRAKRAAIENAIEKARQAQWAQRHLETWDEARTRLARAEEETVTRTITDEQGNAVTVTTRPYVGLADAYEESQRPPGLPEHPSDRKPRKRRKPPKVEERAGRQVAAAARTIRPGGGR